MSLKFCDDISPEHLDAIGSGCARNLWKLCPVSYILLWWRPFFPGVFALPNHVNLIHLCCTRGCAEFPLSSPSCLWSQDLKIWLCNYFHCSGLWTSQAEGASGMIRYYSTCSQFSVWWVFKPCSLKLPYENIGYQTFTQMALWRKLMKNRLDLDFKSEH